MKLFIISVAGLFIFLLIRTTFITGRSFPSHNAFATAFHALGHWSSAHRHCSDHQPPRPHCSTRSCVRLPPTQGWNGSPHHHRSAEWPKQDLLVTVSLQNGQNRTFMSPSFCRMHFHQAWHNRIVDARATNVASFCLISWNCWRITLIPTLELRLCFSWTQADFITWAATSKPMGLFCSMTSWWKQTGWVSGCSIISQCSFFRVMSMGFPLF